MNRDKSIPGVSREKRLSAEGLFRLEKQLQSGTKVSVAVLEQWVRRYGILAKPILVKFNRWDDRLASVLAETSKIS